MLVFCHRQLVYYISFIGGVMVRVLASSVVDRGFEPRSGQTKDNKIGMCWNADILEG
jgi:hypothetical protein